MAGVVVRALLDTLVDTLTQRVSAKMLLTVCLGHTTSRKYTCHSEQSALCLFRDSPYQLAMPCDYT